MTPERELDWYPSPCNETRCAKLAMSMVIVYWSSISGALASEIIPDVSKDCWSDFLRHIWDMSWGDPYIRYPMIGGLILMGLFKYWPWRKKNISG